MCGSRRRSGGGRGRRRNMMIIAQQQAAAAEAERQRQQQAAMAQERQSYQNLINSVVRTPPPAPVAPAPAPEPVQPRSNIDYGDSVATFQPGKKKKRDRGQQSRGTGSLRIPRTAVNASAAGGGPINV